ncbi:REP-associated tyrosine transposase [Leptolyngbya sp. O-77]|uniref:REP-associated tyrosine transposase n=1 Tax=Leptolyngbya sp. O-77 TaxID=1080068 RepID=UPI000B29F90C|nr:transposase [Leptolyngbya sp. O-77]
MPRNLQLLRSAFHQVQQRHPFTIDAIVVLPDHLHCLWTLPKSDANYSSRWRLLKSEFSRHCPSRYKRQRSQSRQHKGEQAIWQRRFWEHQIRDEADLIRHVDYIHYNPVRHGFVEAPKDWVYSSFHRFVQREIYEEHWRANETMNFSAEVGQE